MKRYLKKIAMAISVLTFIACGGGGSGAGGGNSGNTSGSTTNNSSSTIQNEFTSIIGKTGRIADGVAEDVKVSNDGHYAYVANGRKGVAVVDVSNPKKPTLVGTLKIEDTFIKKITLSHDGKTAFLVSGGIAEEKAIYILDISNPTSPTQIGKIQRTETDEDGELYNPLTVSISQDDKKAYIGYHTLGFLIVDITNKSNPTELGKWAPDGRESYTTVSSISLSTDGKIAYVGGKLWGLHIIDVSDPSKPITKNKIMNSKFINTDDSWWTYDSAVSKDGKTLYVVAEPSPHSVLEIFDITDAGNPKSIGGIELQFGGDGWISLSEVSNMACVSTNNGYEYIDISDPRKLSRIKGFNYYASGRMEFSKDGKYLYFVADYMGMYVADTSYNNSAQLGYLNNSTYDTHDIALSNNEKIAYLALDSDGVMSVDISDPSHIKEISIFKHDEFTAMDVQTLKDADQLYVSNSDNGYGIYVVDTSNPSGLNLLNERQHDYSYRIQGPRAMVFAKKRAYIADENDGLKIFDVRDRNNYKLMKIVDLGEDKVGSDWQAVTLSSDLKYAYVINSTEGLMIVDIDEESKTKFEKVGAVKMVDTSYNAMYLHDIAVTPDRKLACITDDNGKLFVVDVSDPKNPKKRGQILGGEEEFLSMKMSKDNKTVFLASGQNGLVVVDISNPDKPKKIGRSTLFGSVHRLEISKDEAKAYVIGTGIKLQVVDLTKLK